MSRKKTHVRIEELLAGLSIHNDRLSLHTESLSTLDIELMRTNCIKLYENILLLEKSPAQSDTHTMQKSEAVTIPKFVPILEPDVQTEVNESFSEPEPEPITVLEPVARPTSAKEFNLNKAGGIDSNNVPEAEMLSLFEKFSSKPIDSIPRAISVAKRFEFQTEFFEGNSTEYKNFMQNLDDADGREDAFEIYHAYKERLQWDNEDLKDELKALMYRKHQS